MMTNTQRHRQAPLVALVALAAAGCVTPGDLRAAVTELNEAQARQAAELRDLRARLDGLDRKREARPAAPKPPEAVQRVPVGDSPVEGPADAWVTVVEFTDFQCPFCSRAQATLQRLRDAYGEEVRFVLKHNPLPFHPNARRAALAAECARAQGRFWDYARILFARQGEMGSDAFRAWAGEVPGIDDARFDRCLIREEPLQRVERDQALAAELGANGTPTFFINGRKLMGAQPLEAFSALIEEELAKAKASGIPAREYYQRTVEAAGGR